MIALVTLLSGCAISPTPSITTGATEPELTCGRLTGRMQVRILSLRSEGSRTQTTSFSRQLQSVGSSTGMTKGQALDPKSRQAQELAELQQMNEQLKKMGCKTFDLAAELQQTDYRVTPRPR